MTKTLAAMAILLTAVGGSFLLGQDTPKKTPALSPIVPKDVSKPEICSIITEKELDTKPWVSEWKNVDPDTPDMTRLVITLEGDQLSIRAFAKCEPTDCDWGSTGLRLCRVIGSKDETVAFGKWDHGFEDAFVILRLKDGKISCECFSIYKDQSERACFVTIETFHRSRSQEGVTKR